MTHPPGPTNPWRNMRRAQEDNLDFLRQTRDQYGDLLYYRLALWPVYRLGHPDHAQHVLQENQRNYNKQSIDYSVLRRISGDGLISSEGALWRRQRRLMQPLFHRRRIAALGEVMTGATERLLAEWDQRPFPEPFNLSEALATLTLDIVSRALFSLEIGETAVTFHHAFNAVNQHLGRLDPLFVIAPWLPTASARRYNAGLRQLNQIIYDLIAYRRANPAEASDDMLTLLLEARDEASGEGMSDQQIRDETITLLIAGHETTANALSWTFYLLAQNPGAREELERELEAVLGGRVPTSEDVPQLVYTQQVIQEAMRLYPPAWFISRTAIAADEIGGYPIPPGAFVSISVYLIQRHPDFWPEPERFDPGRFAPEAEKGRPRYAYLPFGGGPRQCIGSNFAMTEATLLLATIAQRYRLHLPPGHVVQPQPLITLQPKGGLPVLAERRG
jgi:cytochrome P450